MRRGGYKHLAGSANRLQPCCDVRRIPEYVGVFVRARTNHNGARINGDTRRQLQLRIASNNVLNHVVITNIGTTVNATNFGLPTAASATRTVTLNMRLNF